MGEPGHHNKDLFRWKRQTEPLVHHSDARKAKQTQEGADDQVEKWLKRVEAATDVAARRTFSTEEPIDDAAHVTNLHRHFNNNIRFHEQHSEVAYAEAQDLLNDWMTKNFIHELIGDETAEDSEPFRSASPESPLFLESSVTQAVRSNVDLHNLYDNIDGVNENDVVQDIMSNLLVAPIEENAAKLKANKKPKPKEGWLDDLITEKAMKSLKLPTKAKKTTTVEKPGVGHNGKLTQNAMVKMLEEEESREAKIDHKKRIGDRHEQVRQNRLMRERQIEEEREKRRRAKETRRQAEVMVACEEKETSMRRLAEEEAIKNEMARIKREMDEQKAREEEEKRGRVEEEMRRMAAEEEARNLAIREEEEARLEEAARERERQLRLQKLDIRIRNSQLRAMRTHFSAWRNVIIDQRLLLGQARAIADWRLLMKTWATWNGKYKTMWATHEGQRHLEAMRETQRRQKAADAFYKKQLLSKCLRSWNIWTRAQLLDKELEKEKVDTQKKMEAFLKACAINDVDEVALVGADVVDEMDEAAGNRDRLTSKDKSADGRPPQPQKLLPWQVTKKHVYEGMRASPDKDGLPTAKKVESGAKTKAAFIVDTFQHRHQAQEKMLKTQQEIIKEQQKMLEEMKFFATQNALQQQLKDIQSGGAAATTKSPKTSRIVAAFDGAVSEGQSSAPAKPKTTTITATTPTTAKQNKFVRDMEERARQRAERKAELDRLKEQKQKEKIEAQRKKEEEDRRQEEEEKQKRVDEARERKRLEKEQEMEKQRKLDEVKKKQDMAEEHDRRRTLKWFGLEPWKKCLEGGRRLNVVADRFREKTLVASHFRALAAFVSELKAEREKKWIACRNRQLRRKFFVAWRCAKEDSLQLEVKALRFWTKTLKKNVFAAWGNWTHEEKMIGWEKDKKAASHFDAALVRKVFFMGFKQLPIIAKKERERESRKNQLRRKVADLLPDFSGS